jgi:NodT family efflux transporter outer membrane factor (OMF) lipoprotein
MRRASLHPAAAAAFAVLLLLTGCAAGPNYRAPAADVPAAFAPTLTASPPAASAATDAAAAAAAGPAADIDLAAWWKSLEDPQLDALVARAVAANPDLDIALTRLQQARTYESVVLGRALPEVDASAGAARGTGSDLTKGRAAQALTSADDTSGLRHINAIGGFDAVWELDVFGKYRRELEAARDDLQAAAAARNAVLISVVADVVRAYVDLRGFQTQAGILRKGSAVLRESLRIVEIRYQRGITNELDVALATREFDAFQAQLAPLDARISASQYTLAVLTGAYPETMVRELATPQLVPTMPGPAAPGLPVELLRRRPDIQQAERRLAAATARIGVATASLFPQVALIGSLGEQAQGLGTTPAIGKHIWSFGPAALWPLLDFGALDALVDIAHLEAHAQLTAYRRTILAAVQEVDAALDAYAGEQDRLNHLGDALLAGQRALDLATERYNRGLTDFLNVVDAERQFYDLQEQYAAAQVAQAEQFVQLYRSLGGGWQNYQTLPAIRRPQPAIMAAFRRALTPSEP